MEYSGSPFRHAYERFVRAGHTPFIYRVIAAILYSMVTLVISLGIPLTVPQYARLIPDFWSNGILGSAYLYTLITSYCLFFWRIVETKLFSYEEIEAGRWDFAKKSGARTGSLLWAKYLSQMIPPMFTYLLGGAITIGSAYLIFPEPETIPISVACVGVGALSLLTLISMESILAAIGMKKFLLSVFVFVMSFGIFYFWNYSGFLKFTSETLVRQAIHTMYSLDQLLMPVTAAATFLLSLILCPTVPGRRIGRYSIEKMDSGALEELQIGPGIEVFEKNGENFQLVYEAEASVGKKKKK